jgi:hemolysin activation/secretion protein
MPFGMTALRRRCLAVVAAAWWLYPAAAAGAPPPAVDETIVVVGRAQLPFADVFADAAAPVREVAVRGVTQYTAERLLAFAIAHERESLGRSTVSGTVAAIELIYREDGFFLAEARAAYDVPSGRLAIDVVEGVVDRIVIAGVRPKVAAMIRRYLSPLLQRRPLHNDDFERAFMLASDLSGLYLKSAFSHEGTGPGATLTVTGVEDRHVGSLTADTVPVSPDTGLRTYLYEEGRGVFVGGDMLRGFGVVTFEPHQSHSFSGTAFYRAPVGSKGTYFEAFGGNAFSRRRYLQVAEVSEQRGLDAAVAVGHPVKRDLLNYVYAIGEFEYARASSRLGSNDFRSTATSARAYLIQGVTFPRGGLLQWSATASAGARPDTAPGAAPDGEQQFFHRRAGVGVISSLPALSDRAYIRFETSGQWSGKSLPEVERFGVGFQPNLRGYLPWEAEGDRAAAGALEFSYIRPFESGLLRELMPFVFIDAGTLELVAPAAGQQKAQQLYSAGGGMRVVLGRGFSAGAWIGYPLRDAAISKAGEPGFYLRITRGW